MKDKPKFKLQEDRRVTERVIISVFIILGVLGVLYPLHGLSGLSEIQNNWQFVDNGITGAAVQGTDMYAVPEIVDTTLSDSYSESDVGSESDIVIQESGGGLVGIAEANSTSCGTVGADLILSAPLTSNVSCLALTASNLVIDCAGNSITGDGGSTDYGISVINYDNVTVKNCVIIKFGRGISAAVTAGNSPFNNTIINNSFINNTIGTYINGNTSVVYNNTFADTGRGVYLTGSDSNNITNNTFLGNFATNALETTSSAASTRVWGNMFNGSDGITDGSNSSIFCVNGYGNFYNGSVAAAQVQVADCGPTPAGTVYANTSATTSYTWGGASATYFDLRTAVYNTNGTVYMLANESTNYAESNVATDLVRNNIILDCNNYTYSDSVASSSRTGIATNGYNATIQNCGLRNFDTAISITGNSNMIIQNNTLISDGENYGLSITNGDFCNVTNNYIYDSYAFGAIYFSTSSAINNNIWGNYIYSSDAIERGSSVNTSFCVNGIGNFYNSSVTYSKIPVDDCSPTTGEDTYVNDSLTAPQFTWGGSGAVYPTLAIATYNTMSNQTIFFLKNHTTSTAIGDCNLVRNNITINCLGYTYADSTSDSTTDGLITRGHNITILNCTFLNFDEMILISAGSSAQIYNNSFNASAENYGITFNNGTKCNITNNTFFGTHAYGTLNFDVAGLTGNNIWRNSFYGSDAVTLTYLNSASFCVNGVGNYYNTAVTVTNIPPDDCGPAPSSNVSVNTSLTASSFNFSTSSDANPIYASLQEALYNTNSSRTIFLLTNSNYSDTNTWIRSNVTLDCLGQYVSTGGSSNHGLTISSNGDNIVKNCIILPSSNGRGISLSNSSSNLFVNLTVNTTGTLNLSHGVYFSSSSNNNIFANGSVSTPSGAGDDFYSTSSQNNSAVNARFNRTDIYLSTSGNFLVKWYANVSVVDENSTPINGSSIIIYNSSGGQEFSALTGVTGIINHIELLEFVQNITQRNYATSHNISANLSGYAPDSEIVNLSQTNSTMINLVLTYSLYPDLSFNVSTLNYTSGTIKQGDVVNFNFSIDNLGTANASSANVSFYVDNVLYNSTAFDLAQGASKQLNFSYAATGGNHTFNFSVDATNNITESNETNNNHSINLSIKYVAGISYLSPSSNHPRGKNVAGEDALENLVNDSVAVLARVYDIYNSSHNFSANCSFYVNSILVGSNITNSFGICNYTWNKTSQNVGLYNFSVNFTNLEDEAVTSTDQSINTALGNITLYVMGVSLSSNNHYDVVDEYMVGEAAVMNMNITKDGVLYDPDNISAIVRGSTDPADGDSVFSSTLYRDSIGKYRFVSIINQSPNGGQVRWRVKVNSSDYGIIASANHQDIGVNAYDASINLSLVNSSNGEIGSSITIKDSNNYTLSEATGANLSWPTRKDKVHHILFNYGGNLSIDFKNVTLNNTANIIRPQYVENYNGDLPSGILNLTPIVGLENFSYNFSFANITLPKSGISVTRILRCSAWNYTSALCSGTWSNYTSTFGENSTHVWFNVSSFSAYAGGAGYSSALIIWDQNDTGMPNGDRGVSTVAGTDFYANYSNSTTGALITNASCWLNITGVATGIPLNYDNVTGLYTNEYTISAAGFYNWTVSCNHSNYDTLVAQDNITIVEVPGTVCGTINSDVTLTENLASNGTCLNVNASNITINCNNRNINYSTGGVLGYGINITGQNNVTVTGCTIYEGNASTNYKHGIYVENSLGNNIKLTTIYTIGNYSYGISLSNANSSNINNTLINTSGYMSSPIYTYYSNNNTFSQGILSSVGALAYGVHVYTSSTNNRIQTSVINTTGSSAFGIRVVSSNTTVIGCTINTFGSSAEGIYIDSSNNNISNTDVFTNNSQADGYVFNSGSNNNIWLGSINTIAASNFYIDAGSGNVINTSFNLSNISFAGAATGSINVKWFILVNVTNSSGSSLQNANVSAVDTSNAVEYSGLTNSAGLVSIAGLREFTQTLNLKNYTTPHTISATLDGYATNSTTLNLTQTGGSIMIFLVLPVADYYPSWSSNVSSIVSTYSPSAYSNFSVNWSDDVNVSTVLLESNYSGTTTNYSMVLTAGLTTNGKYNYSAILPAGDYYWKSYANDSAGKWNYTSSWTLSIARAASTVNLTINGSKSNISVNTGTILNVNCSSDNAQGNVSILLNGAVVITNITSLGTTINFGSVGTSNITCLYNQTQNYSVSSESYWVTASVPADPYPAWSGNSTSVPATYIASSTGININWSDDVNVSTVLLESNYSGTATNYSMSLAAGTTTNGQYSYFAVFPAGNYYWKSYANDSANQWNYTLAWNISVAKADPIVNLTINGSAANLTAVAGTYILLNCTSSTAQGNVSLYNNGALLNSSSQQATKNNSFGSVGSINVTCSYNSTQNYTSGSVTYWVSVTAAPDTTNPTFDQQPQNQTAEYGVAFSYDINASDNIAIDTYWVNNTNFSVNRSGVITNATLLSLGGHSLNISVNDTSGNNASAGFSVLVQDTLGPTLSTTNISITYGSLVASQFNATDLSNVSRWWINDSNFTINQSGYFNQTNVSALPLGTYSVSVSANDTLGNNNSAVVIVQINAVDSSSSSSGGGGSGSSYHKKNTTQANIADVANVTTIPPVTPESSSSLLKNQTPTNPVNVIPDLTSLIPEAGKNQSTTIALTKTFVDKYGLLMLLGGVAAFMLMLAIAGLNAHRFKKKKILSSSRPIMSPVAIPIAAASKTASIAVSVHRTYPTITNPVLNAEMEKINQQLENVDVPARYVPKVMVQNIRFTEPAKSKSIKFHKVLKPKCAVRCKELNDELTNVDVQLANLDRTVKKVHVIK